MPFSIPFLIRLGHLLLIPFLDFRIYYPSNLGENNNNNNMGDIESFNFPYDELLQHLTTSEKISLLSGEHIPL